MPVEPFDLDQGSAPPPVTPPVEFGPQLPPPVDPNAMPPQLGMPPPQDPALSPPPVEAGGIPVLGAPPDDLGSYVDPFTGAPFGGAPDTVLVPAELPQPPPATPEFGPQYASAVSELPGFTVSQEAVPQAPTAPLSYIQPGDPNGVLPSMREDRLVDPFAGMSDHEAMRRTEQLALDNEPAFDELQRNRETYKQLKLSGDILRAEDEQLRQLKADQEARRIADDKTAKEEAAIEADSRALASKPIDRKRWFRNLNGFQKFAATLAAVVGGLMSKPGGPNHGLDFLSKHIDDDVADQKADIENARGGLVARRGAVAREYERTGNLAASAEIVRRATYQAAITKLQTEQQYFDPRGQGFIEHGKAIQGLVSRDASAREANRKTRWSENLDAVKVGQAEAELQEKIRKNREDAALARAKAAAGAKATAADKVVYQPEQLRALNPSAPVVPPIAMSLKDFGEWQKTQKVGEEYATARRANDPKELDRAQLVPGVVTTTGEPVRFLPDEVKDIKKSKYIATELVRKSDELRALVAAHGYSPGWAKSEYHQVAQQLYNDILLMDKDLKALGALSASDIALEQANLGTDDPTQLRDTMAGMESYRRSVVEGINAKVATHAVLGEGQVLKRWEPLNTAKLPKAQETPEQSRLQSLMEKPTETLDDAVRGEIQDRRAGLSPDEIRDPDISARILRESIAAARARSTPDMSRKQRTAIEELQIEANGPVGDPKADRARADLTKISNSGNTAQIRHFALSALSESAAAEYLGGGEAPVSEPDRAVAREKLPKAQPKPKPKGQ